MSAARAARLLGAAAIGCSLALAVSNGAAAAPTLSQTADQVPAGLELHSGRTSWKIANSQEYGYRGYPRGLPEGATVSPELLRLDSIGPRREPPAPRTKKRSKVPLVRIGNVEVSSGIPVEVIRRIVRQNYGRYRVCYESGLARHPELEGKVAVRFVIGLDGSTSNLRDAGSTLPDADVVRCISSAVGGLSFPKPQGPWKATDERPVSVLVPVLLTPG